ncbi:MAG: LeuD/DmdB family oxidoreductase small subunit, partial [Candidatus Kariarchaeaceae archaeon]
GIDRTETAGLWFAGETWFRVPETLKIELTGRFSAGVYAKDLALWIMGQITSSGANYQAIEYHGEGVQSLSISERMTLANLASEMGAKTAIFPPDQILQDWLMLKHPNLITSIIDKLYWSDEDAKFDRVLSIHLGDLVPIAALPHQVDNIQLLTEVDDFEIQEAFLGTCTNARLDDLTIAASIMKGKRVKQGVQFLVAPASREIYLEALQNGVIETLVEAGATLLTSSCGPCLGKGQGIPADGCNVISTANRNFLGRMGNKKSSLFLGSPATIAASALAGKIVDPRDYLMDGKIQKEPPKLSLPDKQEDKPTVQIASDDDRYQHNTWNYADVNDFNTDQMFSGPLTYDIKSSEPEKIVPHLFKGLDESFAKRVQKDDIIVSGDNFGCGSSREHPAVGLAEAGVKAVIVKSVGRIFYRSAINQGLPIIVHPEIVENFNPDLPLTIDLAEGWIKNGDKKYTFSKLPEELLKIFSAGGLIKYYKGQN